MSRFVNNDLTAFEKTVIDSVRSQYVLQYPGGDPDSLHWETTRKGDSRSLFLFYSKREGPTFFAKCSSTQQLTFGNEFDMLSGLKRNNAVANSVPEVTALIEDGDCSAIVEKAADGFLFPPVRLLQFWERRIVRSRIRSVLSWWKVLVESSRVRDQNNTVPARVELVREALLKCYGPTGLYSRCQGVLNRVAEFGAGTPVLSVVHGDLWRENILLRRDGILVLDWERAENLGLPLLDFLLFLSTLIDDSTQTGFVRVFFAENWLSESVRDCLNEACEFLGLSRSQAEDLFFFFLCIMSSQGMRLSGRHMEWDSNWRARLDVAMKNRESVSLLFGKLAEESRN